MRRSIGCLTRPGHVVVRFVLVASLAIAATFALSFGTAPPARASLVPEIAAPWLDDIAVARMTAQGPVIYYNPSFCKDIGPGVCAFFRAHEYGHIQLRHLTSSYMKLFGDRALAEAEADCFAAKNAMRWQVKAAIAWFLSPERIDFEVGDHGTGRVRAKRLAACL